MPETTSTTNTTSTGFRPIGESFAIELANTVRIYDDDELDYTPSLEDFIEWTELVGLKTSRQMRWSHEDFDDMMALRWGIRSALNARAEAELPELEDIAMLEDAASIAETLRRIRIRDGEVVSWLEHKGSPVDVAIAHVANLAIDHLVSPEPVAICAAHDCSNLFVQNHGRRRYCEPACGSRVRQNRYRKQK